MNQIFVANPDKSKEVENILRDNRDLLIDYLGSFLSDRGMCMVYRIDGIDVEDVFLEEKRLLLSLLKKLL